MLSPTAQNLDKTVFTLLGSMTEPTFLIDPDGMLLYANDAFIKKLDDSCPAALNSNVFEFQASIPEIATGLWEQVDRVLSGCRQHEFKEEHEGRIFHYIVTPECSASGDITRLYIIVHEISEEAGIPHEKVYLTGRTEAG
jgi:PAS domain-containing protein